MNALLVETTAVVEQKTESAEWLMAEVEPLACRLQDAADDLAEALDQISEDDNNSEAVTEAAEDASIRVCGGIFEIKRELNRLHAAFTETKSPT
jgi:hypothetical protein